MEGYKTVHEYGFDEFIVEKSRFIGYARPVSTEEEAKEFVAKIKAKHKDATHNVWAYTVGLNMGIQRYSDDGEPQGTAGIPTLEVIKKEDLRNCAVVVTRYFGGIKLGAGGLVRAYTKGAKIGLEAAGIVQRTMYQEINVELDYTLLGKVQNEISNRGYHVRDIVYTDIVTIMMYIRVDKCDEVEEHIRELTGASATFIRGEKLYLSVKDGKIIE